MTIGHKMRMLVAGSKKLRSVWNGGYYNDTDLTTYTFSGVPLGSSASRKIYLLVGADSSGSAGLTASATVAGVACTIELGSIAGSSNRTRFYIFSVTVPTDTSGTVVVTWSRQVRDCSISVYSVYGSHSIASSVEQALEDVSQIPLTIAASNKGDLFIGGAMLNGTRLDAAWSGVSKDYTSGSAEASLLTAGSQGLSYNAQEVSVGWVSTTARNAAGAIALREA